MRNRGFTLVELLVTVGISCIAFVTAVSFFISMSKMSLDSKAAKAVNQEVAGALGMIAADLRKAGTGLGYLNPEVGASLFVTRGDLYVNWTGWYDYDAIPTVAAATLPSETVFVRDASFTQAMLSAPDGLRVPNTVICPQIRNGLFVGGDFGGLIGFTANVARPIPLATGTGFSATGVNYGYAPAPDFCTATPDDPDNVARVVFAIPGLHTTVTPAVTYRLIPAGAGVPSAGQLMRNWVPILGDPLQTAILRGGARQVAVTAFDITLRFANALGVQQNQTFPNETSQYSPPVGYTLRDLTSVAVRLAYTWTIPGSSGAGAAAGRQQPRSSTAGIEVSPRCIVKAAAP